MAKLAAAHRRDAGPPVATQLEFPLRRSDVMEISECAPHGSPRAVAANVAAFHRAFGLPMRYLPGLDNVDAGLLALRVRLLEEEAAEFAQAAAARDLIGMADALADVVYVAYGTAVTLGVDLDAILAEVHRANMSKLDSRGRPVLREDGKVLKSSRYTPPDVSSVLALQLPLRF